MADIYDGNSFSIKRVTDEWEIWRFSSDDDTERIILTDEAMDELRDYFLAYYDEDRKPKS